MNGTPTTCLAILGYKLLITICIWSLSKGMLMISAIFSRQREMNDEMDSFDLYLRASSSLLNTSTTVLNENCRKNSSVKSSHVRAARTQKMQTNTRRLHSEIVGIMWSFATRLIRGPSSLCCRVGGECEVDLIFKFPLSNNFSKFRFPNLTPNFRDSNF